MAFITYNEALELFSGGLAEELRGRLGLSGYAITPISGHAGGRNLVCSCEADGKAPLILRVSYKGDRSGGDVAAELEFVRYLREGGASVADVITLPSGELYERFECGGTEAYACLFERARGRLMSDAGYRYRDGAPIEEYFRGCGELLGDIHRLSKSYKPAHERYDFFERYTREYIYAIIPPSLPVLRERFKSLIAELRGLGRTADNYGMLHFDFNDGNYFVDGDGTITLFDFDNCCRGFYMYELADAWTSGVGRIARERDAEKRRAFMERYFTAVVDGYRSRTDISEAELARLPLFIEACNMEALTDRFEVARDEGEDIASDGEAAYLIKCIEEGLPYRGFFSDIYSCDSPFELE